MKKLTLDKIEKGVVVIVLILASFFVIRASFKVPQQEWQPPYEYKETQK